ncbi:MAG: hypothetical protein Q9174_002328 [Haloplaca sp. 1 TL-2023]
MAAVAGFPSMTNRRTGNQPHIPRLTYRNAPSTASISDHSIITVGTESSGFSASTCPSSAPPSTYAGSPRSLRFAEGPLSPLSLDGASGTRPSSKLHTSQVAEEPKKKSSSFIKFFSVKEPSTQAFEAYQEQMKKRGTTQSGRANTVGLPGVSSAKLPPTVPRVNSKWDGVPQIKKDRPRDKDNLHRQSMSSVRRPLYTSQSDTSCRTMSTVSSSGSTHSDLRSNGKLQFNNSSGNLSDIYGWEGATQASGGSTMSLAPEGRPSTNSSALPLSRASSSYGTRPSTIPESSSEPFHSPLAPPETLSNQPSPMSLPALPSPMTPNDSVPSLPLSSAHNSLPGKEPCFDNNEPVLLTSDGAHALGPLASAARKPRSTPFLAGEATEFRLPPATSSQECASDQDWSLQPPPASGSKQVKASNATATPAKSKRAAMMSMFK